MKNNKKVLSIAMIIVSFYTFNFIAARATIIENLLFIFHWKRSILLLMLSIVVELFFLLSIYYKWKFIAKSYGLINLIIGLLYLYILVFNTLQLLNIALLIVALTLRVVVFGVFFFYKPAVAYLDS